MAISNKKTDKDLNVIRALIKKHKKNDQIFAGIGFFIIISLAITLLVLFLDLVIDGYPKMNLDFFSNFPSRKPEGAGILSAWVGSALVLVVTFFVAVPMGVAAGVYLEEYAKKGWFADLIEINVANLAGVPSIIYGLLALGLFVCIGPRHSACHAHDAARVDDHGVCLERGCDALLHVTPRIQIEHWILETPVSVAADKWLRACLDRHGELRPCK